MSRSDPTFVGEAVKVAGGVVTVRLRDDMPSTLIMVEGESYRVGQVGAYLRIPMGYAQLYGVCTQVGSSELPQDGVDEVLGYRWLSMSLFGESIGQVFERGIGQYPTVGDEVHIVTQDDLRLIYGSGSSRGAITIGTIAASSGIAAKLDVASLVSRHSAVVGSTGAGKSNLVTILLEAIATQGFPRSRVLVIDPHGEYPAALKSFARIFKINADMEKGENELCVPFWALPFDELRNITLGGLQPNHESAIREEVLQLKKQAAAYLDAPPPEEALTADAPIPFSINQLWFQLDDFERQTFSQANNQSTENRNQLENEGDAEQLLPNQYPAASTYNQAPFKNQKKRNIERHLELMRNRLRDARYRFLFDPGGGYTPNMDGEVDKDLDQLVGSWVGHDSPVTVMDVSGLPADVLSTVVGTVLRIIYDTLFWASDLPMGGREQPLLVVLEEAHLFLPEGKDTASHRTIGAIAKEGRKYGVGIMLVTQRPTEIDSTALSQCGTMISLRLTNSADRSKVESSLPDNLGELSSLLPSLRTGEGLVFGEAILIPSRVRFSKAANKPAGDDPRLPDIWIDGDRPDVASYAKAVSNWRAQMNLKDSDSENEE